MVLNQWGQLSSEGWVSPSGRNPTNRDAIHENVGLRDETANTSYKADVFADIKDTAFKRTIGNGKSQPLDCRPALMFN